MILRLLAIISLLLVNGFFVAAEFALVRARRSRLEAMTRTGDRLARIALRAMAEMPRMLSASQFGITLSSLGLGAVLIEAVVQALAEQVPGVPGAVQVSSGVVIGATLAFVVVTWLHVSLAELAPRAAALAHPERIARLLAPGLLAFARVTAPLLVLIERTAALFARPFRGPAADEDGLAPEELRLLVEQSEERGELEEHDAALLEGVFDFSEKTAREVMTPRTEIAAIPLKATLDEMLAIIADNLRSRYPVFDETIDDVVGVLLAKDLLSVLRHVPADFRISSVMRPVHFIPGSRAVDDVLADFKRLKVHMAIVLDEYGGTAGLVTMEDLLEEIVGEILDEYDEPEISARPEPSGEIVIPAATNIGELNERFGLAIPEDEYATVGGYVFGTLGRLPAAGDRVTGGGAVFTVRRMEGRRIEMLAVDLSAAGDRRGDGRRTRDHKD